MLDNGRVIAIANRETCIAVDLAGCMRVATASVLEAQPVKAHASRGKVHKVP